MIILISDKLNLNTINIETKDMSFEELRKYIDNKLKTKTRLVGQ